MTAKSTSVEAIKMAIRNRGVKDGLIFHSDRGIQYACEEFREVTVENRIVQSMSRKANCWDNAVAESFFKTLKAEMIYQDRKSTRLNSSHVKISYAVFCLKKKKQKIDQI